MNKSRTTRGFTLIEVLIAVAILAVAMSVFLSGASQYADNAHYMKQRSIANLVAHNRLVEMQQIEPWPDEGRQEGPAENGGQQWRWRSEVSESPDPRVRKVEVTVFAVESEREPLADDASPTARMVAYLSPRAGGAASGSGNSAAEQVLQDAPDGLQF